MAEVIRMPKMSDTMEEGVIATWLKKVGDTVQSGDILAEVDTDKATMELEAYEEGTLLHIGVQEKEAVAINGVIAIIGNPNEDISMLLEEIKQPDEVSDLIPANATDATTVTIAPQPMQPTPAVDNAQPIVIQDSSARLFVSPLAKKMAQVQGYDLRQIQGTGEGGRIIKRDIENLLNSQPSNINPSKKALTGIHLQEAYEDQPVSQMRKAIAKRLSESKLTAPEFELTMRIHMDQVVAARPQLNEYAPVKITFNDIVIKAVAMALKKHPLTNVAWLGEKIRYYQHIHIGVAMAVETGLLVPVIRFADQLSLSQIASQVKELSEKAHQNQLQPADWEGSTFTISNLGMLGIESFTAIINPPAACILAVGAIQQLPVVKQGAVVPGYIMKVTLTCDHRVVDGAGGAAFLKTLKELLEDPLRLLV